MKTEYPRKVPSPLGEGQDENLAARLCAKIRFAPPVNRLGALGRYFNSASISPAII